MFNREIKLIGEENFKKLQNAKIIIFGVGGVGGFVAEFLVRAGIVNLTLVDYDTIDLTNKNRQIIALDSTLNNGKVFEFKSRLIDINKEMNLIVHNKKLTESNIWDFNLKEYDFIVDAIDDFQAKCSLIKFAYDNSISIVSALSAGNKFGIPNYLVSDLSKTEYDPIAKKLRKFAKENCIKKLNVVYSKEQVQKTKGVIGSISYHPPACASVITGFVINQIIKENENE